VTAASLYERAAAALHAVGRDPDLDATAETIRFVDDGRVTLGVVLNHSRAVVFHSVWPEQVPTEALVRISEFVLRANTDLYTSAFELDLDKRILSVRSALDCSALEDVDVDVDEKVFGALLAAAADEVRRVARTHHDALAGIIAGGDAVEALAART
jgi:hypothetical protein